MSSEKVDTALAEFQASVGEIAQAEPAEYVVDGVTPRLALVPASVDEVSQCLAAANEAGLVVVPWGGGTQMGFGNLPEAYDVALDLRRLDQIVTYEPDDMTAAVQAGCTLGALNARLAANTQMLPVDAADPERATLGGLVVSGLSGPRRFGYGALRDLIIGVTAVLPDGRIAKAGGMVVKNVSGFDMMRLYHGSHGALAVIVQVNLKLIPKPLAERTVAARFDTLAPAAAAAEAMRLSQLAPTAITLLDRAATAEAGLPEAAWTLLLRCEAPPVAVVRQADRIREAVSVDATAVDVLEADQTESLWQRVAAALSCSPETDGLRVRIGARPSELPALAEQIDATVAGTGLEAARTLDIGSGIAYVGVAGGTEQALGAAWQALLPLGDHASLLTAPAEVKAGLDVFGREPAGFAIMRALKDQFDPVRVLNRGRFAGRL